MQKETKEILKWEQSPSSNIEEYAYLTSKNELWIRFRNGPMYCYVYSKVPLAIFNAFKRSTSQGRYYVGNIKGVYGERKVEG